MKFPEWTRDADPHLRWRLDYELLWRYRAGLVD